MSDILREELSQSWGATITSRLYLHSLAVVSAKQAEFHAENERALVTPAHTARVIQFPVKRYCKGCGDRVDGDVCLDCALRGVA